MNLNLSRSLFYKGTAVLAATVVAAAVTGCGFGTVTPFNGADTTLATISGRVHGGPNPIVGATVSLYNTTSAGYGAAPPTALATTTTNSNGNWTFASSGYTCPAGQFAYLVVTGGKTGSNAVNPNSVLMTAIGPCAGINSTTFIYTNELTTVAAAYALSNFITISGNSSSGYSVGVSSSAANNSTTGSGCVHNSYYGLVACPATATYGLGHAFNNANALVPYTTGTPPGSGNTATGAVIPVQLLNTLGDVLQSCVNSAGGGTNGAGAPTTTTGASSSTTDGTACGNISAYTSYTTNGTTSGTLVASGNTLGMMQNLAKHPAGGPSTTFTNGGTTVCSGTPATCLFGQAAGITFYQLSLSAAPPDWSIAISWPKGSFSNATNTATCTGSTVPATNGILYPYMLATDINDNIDIINGDGSTAVCTNVISIGYDGTPIGANAFDTTGALPNWIANDSFGHSIVPVHGSGSQASPSTNDGVRVYATGTDTSISLINTYESTTATASTTDPELDPYFVAIDANDTIWIASQGALNDIGWLTLNGTSNSHSSPSYTAGVTSSTALTSKMSTAFIDINNNFFSAGTSSSGTSRPYIVPATSSSGLISSAPAYTESPGGVEDANSSTSKGALITPDANGNVWELLEGPTSSGQSGAPNNGNPAADYLFSVSYTGTTFASTGTDYNGVNVTSTTANDYDFQIQPGQVDGNGVIWWSDLQGSGAVTISAGITYYGCTQTSSTNEACFSYLHGFDTVNKTYLPTLFGCAFTTTTSTACGTQSTDTAYPSSAPYPFYGVRGVAVDSAGDVWTANGTQGKITEVIGIAAPTWPLFIHNGSSNKP